MGVVFVSEGMVQVGDFWVHRVVSEVGGYGIKTKALAVG